jgi:RNA polymerase sigma-70 factor, ECF subfamily
MRVTGRSATHADATARSAAFAALADRQLTVSYRLAALILGDAGEAQDATHDAVVVAWRRFAQLRDPGRFEVWFQRILVNVCRDRARHRRRHPVVELSLAPEHTRDDEQRAVAERDEMGAAFARLPVDHRVVLVLRYHRDLSVDEIAARLAIPPGTVKSRLHRALEQLGDAIRESRAREASR